MQTIKYDVSVPIDVISTSCSRLNTVDNMPGKIDRLKYHYNVAQTCKKAVLPIANPDISVAMRGVRVFSLTLDRNSNSRPSMDMAYRIRGTGNRHPIKLNAGKGKK